VLGPQAGNPDPGLRLQIPVVYEGSRVAELVVDGCDDPTALDRVAKLIATHCLVGWGTAREPWQPSPPGVTREGAKTASTARSEFNSERSDWMSPTSTVYQFFAS